MTDARGQSAIQLDGGPLDGSAAMQVDDPSALSGRDVRVPDPGGSGVLVYGPVRQVGDDDSWHAAYIRGEPEGFYIPVAEAE